MIHQNYHLLTDIQPDLQQCEMVSVSLSRDGGLKRAKVKASLKEQQQKQYSSMVVGDDSSSNSD